MKRKIGFDVSSFCFTENMLAYRLTTVPLTAFVTCLGKSSKSITPVLRVSNLSRVQKYATDSASRSGRFARKRFTAETGEAQSSIKSRLMAPAGEGGNEIMQNYLHLRYWRNTTEYISTPYSFRKHFVERNNLLS